MPRRPYSADCLPDTGVAVPSRLDLGLLLEQFADLIAAKIATRMPRSSVQNQRRLLTVELAAQYLGRTKAGVQHLVASGALPVVKSDRRVFLDIHDLDRWIDENKRERI
jgi:excisionase family DNA binding protein